MSRPILRSQAGTSLVELLIVTVIGAVVSTMMAQYQANLMREAQAMRQKMESSTFAQEMNTALASNDACSCNVQGLVVAADPQPPPGDPQTYHVDFPAGFSLYSAMNGVDRAKRTAGVLSCPPRAPINLLATKGRGVERAAVALPVANIRIVNMVKTNTNLAAELGTEYIGNLQVQFGEVPDFAKLLRPIQPVATVKRFFVNKDDNTIMGCGAAPAKVYYQTADVSQITNNPPSGMATSTALCPPGYTVMGGGWHSWDTPAPMITSGCYTSLTQKTRANGRYVVANGWTVHALCHAIQAIAVCYKASTLN